MFGKATGYLGWSPDQALVTPIPQILLALDYRVDWVKRTSPFGSGDSEEKSDKPSPDDIRNAFRSRGIRKAE